MWVAEEKWNAAADEVPSLQSVSALFLSSKYMCKLTNSSGLVSEYKVNLLVCTNWIVSEYKVNLLDLVVG